MVSQYKCSQHKHQQNEQHRFGSGKECGVFLAVVPRSQMVK